MSEHQPVLFFKSKRQVSAVSHQINLAKEVVFERGILPGVLQCATTTLHPGAKVFAHCHDSMAELFYVISGGLLLQAGGAQHLMRAGDTFLVPPKCTHAFDVLELTEVIYLNFEMEGATPAV